MTVLTEWFAELFDIINFQSPFPTLLLLAEFFSRAFSAPIRRAAVFSQCSQTQTADSNGITVGKRFKNLSVLSLSPIKMTGHRHFHPHVTFNLVA